MGIPKTLKPMQHVVLIPLVLKQDFPTFDSFDSHTLAHSVHPKLLIRLLAPTHIRIVGTLAIRMKVKITQKF